MHCTLNKMEPQKATVACFLQRLDLAQAIHSVWGCCSLNAVHREGLLLPILGLHSVLCASLRLHNFIPPATKAALNKRGYPRIL